MILIVQADAQRLSGFFIKGHFLISQKRKPNRAFFNVEDRAVLLVIYALILNKRIFCLNYF